MVDAFKHRNFVQCAPRRSRGAALVMALVFLIALTLLGLASLGGNVLQQRMAYSLGEYNLAFQGAESAVTDGELWLETQAVVPPTDCMTSFSSSCADRNAIWRGGGEVGDVSSDDEIIRDVILAASPDSVEWWEGNGRLIGFTYDDTGATLIDDREYVLSGETLETNDSRYPRYVVEYLGRSRDNSARADAKGPFLEYYRVTGRGVGVLGSGAPILTQSVYTRVQ